MKSSYVHDGTAEHPQPNLNNTNPDAPPAFAELTSVCNSAGSNAFKSQSETYVVSPAQTGILVPFAFLALFTMYSVALWIQPLLCSFLHRSLALKNQGNLQVYHSLEHMNLDLCFLLALLLLKVLLLVYQFSHCLLYTSPSPRDGATSRMPSSA